MHNKLTMIHTVYDEELRVLRDHVIKSLTTDMEDIVFKFRDIFRVLDRHTDNQLGGMYITFEKYIAFITYEEELLDHITTLLHEAYEILTLQSTGYSGYVSEFEVLSFRLANRT